MSADIAAKLCGFSSVLSFIHILANTFYVRIAH